jgi:Hint module
MADVERNVVQIETAAGQRLSLTSGHFVGVHRARAVARSILVGDMVYRACGRSSAVSRVSTVKGTVLFGHQTLVGDVFVDSVLSPTHTTAVEPGFAYFALRPIRAFYTLLGWSSLAFEFCVLSAQPTCGYDPELQEIKTQRRPLDAMGTSRIKGICVTR